QGHCRLPRDSGGHGEVPHSPRSTRIARAPQGTRAESEHRRKAVTAPHHEPKALEPWALELLRQDRAGHDPATEQELARLVALLRALPDPESSPDLTRRILAHVAAHEAQPRVVRVLFGAARQISNPGVAAMLAAGIAAVIAIGLAPQWIPSALRVAPNEI